MSADQQNPQDRQNQDAQETQQIQDVQQTQPITDAKASVTGGKTNGDKASVVNVPAGEASNSKTTNTDVTANGDTAEAPDIDGVSWNWAATHRGEAQPADAVAKASAQARQAPGGQPHQPSQAPEQNRQVSSAGQAARAGQAAGAGQAQAPPQASPYGYAPQSYPQQPYPQQPQYQSPYGVPGAYPAPTGTQKKPKKPSKNPHLPRQSQHRHHRVRGRGSTDLRTTRRRCGRIHRARGHAQSSAADRATLRLRAYDAGQLEWIRVRVEQRIRKQRVELVKR